MEKKNQSYSISLAELKLSLKRACDEDLMVILEKRDAEGKFIKAEAFIGCDSIVNLQDRLKDLNRDSFLVNYNRGLLSFVEINEYERIYLARGVRAEYYMHKRKYIYEETN